MIWTAAFAKSLAEGIQALRLPPLAREPLQDPAQRALLRARSDQAKTVAQRPTRDGEMVELGLVERMSLAPSTCQSPVKPPASSRDASRPAPNLLILVGMNGRCPTIDMSTASTGGGRTGWSGNRGACKRLVGSNPTPAAVSAGATAPASPGTRRSATNTSRRPFVSPTTRLSASDVNATRGRRR